MVDPDANGAPYLVGGRDPGNEPRPTDSGDSVQEIGTIAPLHVDKRTGRRTSGPAQPLMGRSVSISEF
jgi:hypothetical protein